MDVRELKDKASQLFSKGKFAKAAETYEEYCRADLKDLQARLRLGDAWVKAGKKDKAVTAYTWAAEGFAKDGFLPRAIAASKLVLEVDPAHKGVQKMLADLYAQKSSTPSRISKLPTGPGLPEAAAAGPEAITHGTSAQGTAAGFGFANRADAIDLDAPVTAPKRGSAPAEAPSPMNRADAIDVPEFSMPIETGRSSVGGVAATRGPSPATNAHAIEVDFGDEPPAGPAPLVDTQVQLDLSAPEAGEVEISIEDSAPIQGSPILEEPPPPPPPPEPEPGLSHILSSLPTLQVPGARPPRPEAPADRPSIEAAAASPSLPGSAAPGLAGITAAAVAARAAAMPPPAPLPISFELDVEAAPSAPIFDLEVEEAELAPEPEAPLVSAPPLAGPPQPPLDAAPPPGLRARKGEAVAVPPLVDATPPFQTSPSRIRLPSSFSPVQGTPPRPASSPSSPVLLGPPATDLERSLQAFMQHDEARPPDHASTPSALAASFTELELEGDSLLQSVEAAAAAPHPDHAPAEEPMDAPDEARSEPGALPRIPLFSDLPADAFIALFEQCPLRRFDEGQTIIEQGTTGESFFVICAGRVKVFRTDGPQRREVATLDEGAFFGEMALLSHAPRSASILAAGEDTQVLEISAALLTELSAKYPTVSQALKKFCRQRLLSNLMSSAPLFQPFSRSDRRDLIQKFRARDVRVGDVVVREGAACDGLYVVLSGEVEVRVKGVRVAALREGEIFGEMSLLTKSVAGASVVSTRHTSLLRLPRADFDALISSYPQILEHVAELTDARRQRNALV